jgi:hypothetical protein
MPVICSDRMLCRTFSAGDRQPPQRRSWRSYVSSAIADYVHNRSGQHVYDDDVLQAINDASLDKGLPYCFAATVYYFASVTLPHARAILAVLPDVWTQTPQFFTFWSAH